jgi:hypothetical protein
MNTPYFGANMFKDESNFQAQGSAHDFIQLKRIKGHKPKRPPEPNKQKEANEVNKPQVPPAKVKGRKLKISALSSPQCKQPLDELAADKLQEDSQSARTDYRDARIKQRIHQQTGPTSEEGKKAVSQNAIKHGGYATPREEDWEYARIGQNIFGLLEPVGEVQSKFVESIAYEIWHINKVEQTVVQLEREIDTEGVSLSRLADELEFPFPSIYRDLVLLYANDFKLERRVRENCAGTFTSLLNEPSHPPTTVRPSAAEQSVEPLFVQANERAMRMLLAAEEIFSRPVVLQYMEPDFFEEFDAVMLDARLGRNAIGAALKGLGQLMPLVECWVYRNREKIFIAERRLLRSLRLDLLTDPRIERALKGARSRLKSLLSDYIYRAPHVRDRVEMLGYWT